MADLDKIVDSLSSLTVIEAADLVKQLEEKWDVSAAAPAAVAVAGPAGGGEEAEEKDSFDVMLIGDGGKKIPCIKVVRSLLYTFSCPRDATLSRVTSSSSTKKKNPF